ncbi:MULTISPECIES: methylenetetrahydrofolate reductase [Dehalobacter]|uniref:Methylenetetrahydrofolate reductase n=1 Tax=Dehalobacter restrictus TaxID=55583 RepID=A0A857DI35_9FIRM|nr:MULTISPECIES: methylenetetrahydrofolate reductase [Dehalobacter]MCG1025946.1 methylenetetrahydrofolate reductase [Dehalobacter sp.]MDJ0304494.1 methylenetetrahydrofolate reductase [Dehalobacter sp.]OCZ53151.1 5,10-methylenetetrahydrofolate reductase [Dehalobacter sp. TeCB1]QGZ99994.1 5,10-methylenetetrahydrofolate reductase [Dehalobacter restrictus]
MKISELFKTGKPTLSFEYFPARTEKNAEILEKTLGVLAGLNPSFVSVTFGAGGSTREGSYELVKKLKQEKKLEVVAYLAAYGLRPDEVAAVLDAYQDLGIENILALRGDLGKDGAKEIPADTIHYAYELVTFAKKNYNFCIGVAGYPEGHLEAPSLEKDIEYLRYKVDQGADFVIANFFHDNIYFYHLMERCQKSGITIPVIPGLMPVYSVKMMEMLAANCGATIPEQLKRGIAALPEGDADALVEFGIQYAAAQCEELLQEGACGLHFYTMDRSESTAGIVKILREKGLL